MYLRKISPGTTCLYSAASMLSRSASVSPGPDHTLDTADDELPDELVPDGLLGQLPNVPKKCLASAPSGRG